VKPVETAPAQAAAMEAKRELKTSGVLSEADALALAKKSNCLAVTRSQENRSPAWRDVAAKYRNDAGAESRLVDKVAKGGKGRGVPWRCRLTRRSARQTVVSW